MSDMSKPNVVLRKARNEDLDDAIWVESLSTPSLSYVPHVWDMFLNDKDGEWTMEELDGKTMGMGKYSILPDGTAWLETLRVVPEAQGLGLGKRLYELWVKLSEEKGVKAMRMYTGVSNAVSSGLAERYGLSTVETFHGTKMGKPSFEAENTFKNITDVEEATKLLLPLGEKWGNWMVMNRTYYMWSSDLCKWLTENGMVYRDNDGNVVVMGARFMKEFQLHLGLFDGDSKVCLDFAKATASKNKTSLHCLFPDHCAEIESILTEYGFDKETAPFIVKERKYQ
jgi:ribosomal protein S18 acetylase RimI-like enzyme